MKTVVKKDQYKKIVSSQDMAQNNSWENLFLKRILSNPIEVFRLARQNEVSNNSPYTYLIFLVIILAIFALTTLTSIAILK